MDRKLLFYIGILGISFFIFSAIIGGLLIENYHWTSQYISESYAIDTEHGFILRVLGYIPSGIFITLFCFLAPQYFNQSKLIKTGFYGLGVFYGIATIIVSIFPCDSGCNKEFIAPSISQAIHNLAGAFTYLFVPVCILIIGLGLKKSESYKRLSIKAITYAVVSFLCILFFFSNPNSPYIGIYQRIIEGIFILWIITCATFIKNKNSLSSV